MALDENGKFLALRVNTLANIGGYISTFGPNIPTNLYGPLLAGVYMTPSIYCDMKVVFTNTVPVDAYRGPGGRKRPLCSSGWSTSQRAKWELTVPTFAAAT